MKTLLNLEEALMFVVPLYLISFLPLPFHWAWFILIFFAPDLGMLGYLLGNKAGAFTYNLLHHKGLAILIGGLGALLANDWLIISGLILFSHASFDRMLGYGLKLNKGFKHTHLGDL